MRYTLLFHYLLLPLCYLRWMYPILPGYLVRRLLTLYRFYRYPRLKLPIILLPLHLLICTPFLVFFSSMPASWQTWFSILTYCPVFGVHYIGIAEDLLMTIVRHQGRLLSSNIFRKSIRLSMYSHWLRYILLLKFVYYWWDVAFSLSSGLIQSVIFSLSLQDGS
ncbi:hypothetical protein B188_18400 [Candidatus Brocadiaceae bacterium B188]|nr:hypothetical protein B188_18400 [Candidatus Brocadiaceae bacterium B188]